MVLMLDEDQSYSLNAFVTSPGFQSVIPRGFILQRRSDGVYAAPFLPRLFYGADGAQLGGSWRQNLTGTGDQVILSRSGGQPSVPREELSWRKVSESPGEVEKPKMEMQVNPIVEWWNSLPLATKILLPLGSISVVATGAYLLTRPE